MPDPIDPNADTDRLVRAATRALDASGRHQTHSCQQGPALAAIEARLDRMEPKLDRVDARLAEGDKEFARMKTTMGMYGWVANAVGIAVIGGVVTVLIGMVMWVASSMNGHGQVPRP